MAIESYPCPKCGEYGVVYDGILAWRSGPRPPRKLASRQVGFSPRADYEREHLYHCDNCGAEFFQDMEQRRSIHLYEEGVSGRYIYDAAEGGWEFRFFDRAKGKWTTRPLETQHEGAHRPDKQKRKPGWLGRLSEMAHAILSSHIEDGQVYVIQAGDSLRKLADKFYGDPSAWPTIWKATNLKFAEDSSFMLIADPDVIRAGQKLWIPNANKVKQLLTEPDKSSAGSITGVFVEQSAGHCSILRFYEDGLVLNATVQISGGVVQSLSRIKQWFHRENANPHHFSGHYRLISDHLSFFIAHEEEKVAYYAGTCLGDRLILSSFGRKNREYVRLTLKIECFHRTNSQPFEARARNREARWRNKEKSTPLNAHNAARRGLIKRLQAVWRVNTADTKAAKPATSRRLT